MNNFICLSCFKPKPYAEREFFRPSDSDHEKMICADCALIMSGQAEGVQFNPIEESWEHG